MTTEARKANQGLDLKGRTAAIAGGSQGIGAATAKRFAQAGADVFIVGRNAEKGQQVVNQLKQAGAPRAEFIQADLSLVSGVKDVAKQIEQKTNGQLHYLITSQGGPPNGGFKLTSENHEEHFAIQVLGRFGLAYLLAESGTLKDTWVTICAPTGKNGSAPNLDDLELKSEKERNKWVVGRIMATGSNDGAVTDGVVSHFSTVFPHLRAAHLFPGYVQTSAASNQGFPYPIVLLQSIFSPILTRTIGNTAESYADIPVYIAANPAARARGGLEFSNERLKPYQVPRWAREDVALRKRLWDTMASMIKSEPVK